ncbi:iron-containing redox enzyme family protein [Streptantibioticus cattleyicolor]|uniref:Iron-containing redox enzyme n=1 Tax=Streptantibioticus cattleyicolor (strain ATCC 35852 / DSM 46488 / JCM 4925 / NBRC 14057 / NRRL 8057) TaxID=1003195 RepID=F8JJ67_STREN|nr:iron-containing redox enzyme family protein [Streptantibioticus cattleyicolor]AEW98831.1 hypothetical protein SCATT_p06380 [Streptantibioticus cattleyicolor NRRL 8057 = DSM 46488]CCB72121.1 conserved protein of unknown function [Streptantibioticus cattleyicolor NRRL 8057 = DSM 46488]
MTTTAAPATPRAVPAPPAPRGPVSAAITAALRRPPPAGPLPCDEAARADPYGDDLQLALHLCYELHYRGFAGTDPAWEWDPELLRLRGALEDVFLRALRDEVAGGTDLDGELSALLTEPVEGTGVSHHLVGEGTWEHLREFFAHRSVYHLKEADPHAWVIPRLRGRAKAALVAVEFDEYGGGRAERVHATLFADLLAAAGLDPGYGGYVPVAPAVALAPVNLMSCLGLHRALRGALVGHFTAAEITTAPSARRLVRALDRLAAPEPCRRFYREHIEADAVHEQVMRHEVIGGLLTDEPDLAADVVFGIQATNVLEERLGGHLLDHWRRGVTSLREPLPGAS